MVRMIPSDIERFFWVFEAREDRLNAPPSIWLIAMWTKCLWGRHEPDVTRLTQEQNEKIMNETITEKGTKLTYLNTFGIIDGCVDGLVERHWP